MRKLEIEKLKKWKSQKHFEKKLFDNFWLDHFEKDFKKFRLYWMGRAKDIKLLDGWTVGRVDVKSGFRIAHSDQKLICWNYFFLTLQIIFLSVQYLTF
jgi:hypothetical protein